MLAAVLACAALVASGYISIRQQSWLPFAVGVLIAIIAGYMQLRLIPLVGMSTREVKFHRVTLVLFFIAWSAWVSYRVIPR